MYHSFFKQSRRIFPLYKAKITSNFPLNTYKPLFQLLIRLGINRVSAV
jgi:hypothetical protein